MPTYVYETIPNKDTEEPLQFEIWQRMADEPLTKHPETGQPVRRVLSAGLSIMSKGDDCCNTQCGCG
ncbi:MAG TPA: hypothetical protein DCY79_10995 [Planctomycetaceae bacterium]|nr:hypothetical protein [Blastopirellula sp.]HAY80322.1 hypothetical protein [Planctomycetaceae bacterium]